MPIQLTWTFMSDEAGKYCCNSTLSYMIIIKLFSPVSYPSNDWMTDFTAISWI